MRKTHSLIKVIAALLKDPTEQHWGYELSRQSGIRSGVLYPILRRMLEQGWLEDGWEETGTASRKRPPRRYYKLTGEGEQRMREILSEAESEPRFAAPVGQGI